MSNFLVDTDELLGGLDSIFEHRRNTNCKRISLNNWHPILFSTSYIELIESLDIQVKDENKDPIFVLDLKRMLKVPVAWYEYV